MPRYAIASKFCVFPLKYMVELYILGRGQVVRRLILAQEIEGSNPSVPAKKNC